MKKFLSKLIKNLFFQIVSLFIILGFVALAAISWPTTPTGQVSGGKFQEYFDKIFQTCPEGKSLAGYDENKVPVCLDNSSNIGVGPEGSVLTSTVDGAYEWKFIGSLPRFECSDEPSVNTKVSTGWTAVNIPTFCMDKRCMLKYEMYLNSTNALYTKRFIEYEQSVSDSNKWWSEVQPAGSFINGDASSVNVARSFGDGMLLRDDKSGTETSPNQLSIADTNASRYTKLYFCGDSGNELETRDLTCKDYINTSSLNGWKAYDVPPECKSPSGCEFTVTLYTKKAATKTTPAYFTAGVPKQYNFKQRSDDNHWESTSNGTKLFQLINGDKTTSDVIPPFSAYLYLRDDYKKGKDYEDYNSGSISVGDLHDSRYRDIKVCTYE